MARLQVVGSAEEVDHWVAVLRRLGVVAAASDARAVSTNSGRVYVTIEPLEPAAEKMLPIAPARPASPPAPPVSDRRRPAPTAEQQQIRKESRALRAGRSLKVEAYAGAGKTSTLRMVATDAAPARLLYLAFNKRQQEEAKKSFPGNVDARTAHGLAWREMRMQSDAPVRARIFGHDVAELLSLPSRWSGLSGQQAGELVAGTLDRFLQSAAKHVEPEHAVLPDGGGESESGALVHWAQQLWQLQQDGGAPFTHDSYLKSWHLKLLSGQLQPPHYDKVLFDEAQDANPVMVDIVRMFKRSSVIWVGDPFQQIYEWRGAVDALRQIEGEALPLSQSFRFGEPVAEAALAMLRHHPRPPRVPLRGNPSQSSIVQVGREEADRPHAILARGRAGLMEAAFAAAKSSKIHVVGGVSEVKAVMESACALYEGNLDRITTASVARFAQWKSLTDYVEMAKDREMAFVARQVERRGPEGVRRMLARIATAQTEAEHADVTLSTVHRAKGLEWGCVQLMDDILGCEEIEQKLFKDPQPKSPEDLASEMHVSYVAVTRAMHKLIVPPGLLPSPQTVRKEGAPRAPAPPG